MHEKQCGRGSPAAEKEMIMYAWMTAGLQESKACLTWLAATASVNCATMPINTHGTSSFRASWPWSNKRATKHYGGGLWLAGAPVSFVITPLDAHGNPGASGGRFAVELICAAEAASEEAWPRSVECTVTESSSGATQVLAGIPQSLSMISTLSSSAPPFFP